VTSSPAFQARLTTGELLAALGEDLGTGQTAEVYAAIGLPVLPLFEPAPSGGCACGDGTCERPGKHPRVRGGVHAATIDPQVVRRWWERWPAANVALATGVVFDVCDIDSAEGVEALRAILSDDSLNVAQAPLVRTGGGGWHLLFAPTGLGCPTVDLEEVDWRGRDGYIVAPPSRHPNGHRYRWVRPPGNQLPEVPAALRARLERPRPATGAPVAPVRAASRWAAAALVAEAHRVATTPNDLVRDSRG